MKKKSFFLPRVVLLFIVTTLILHVTQFYGENSPKNGEPQKKHQIYSLNIRHTITLITGDRLFLSKNSDGSWAIERVDYAARECGPVPFYFQKTDDRGFFIIPSDVAHLIPKQLDPTFFNIDFLIENKMDDENIPFISAFAETSRNFDFEYQLQSKGVDLMHLASSGTSILSIEKKNIREKKNVFFNFQGKDSQFSAGGIDRLRMDRIFRTQTAENSPVLEEHSNFFPELGLNGDRINIAILDSGVDFSHSDFYLSDGSSKLFVNEDYTCLTTNAPYICDGSPNDLFGTGTHTAGVALGSGNSSSGANRGVAPQARLLNIKVLNKEGTGLESHFLKGIERAVFGTNMERGDEPSIEADVIALSFFHSVLFENDHIAHYVDEIVKMHNIPIIAGVGSGKKNSYSVSTPGFSERVITVGASENQGSINLWEENNIGPTPFHFSVKPDLSAPGVSIQGPCSSKDSTCDLQNPYQIKTSTTVSAATVAGSVALLIQQSRENGVDISVEEIRDILLSSSQIIPPDTQNMISIYEQGAGVLDIQNAILSDLIMSPALVNLGSVKLDQRVIEKNISIKNRGNASKSLFLRSELYDVPKASYSKNDVSSFHDAISITPKAITIDPGQSVPVTVRVNLNILPIPHIWTVYDGRILLENNQGIIESHAVFGFTREGDMQDLQIKGILPDGSPAAHTHVAIVNPKDTYGFENSYFGNLLNEEGSLSLRVPKGLYNIYMQYSIGGCPLTPVDAFYRISALEVKVGSSPIQLVFDAKKAKPVNFSVPIGTAERKTVGEESFLIHQYPGRPDTVIGTFSMNGYKIFAVDCNRKPAIGRLNVYHRWSLANTPFENMDEIYNWADLRNIDKGFSISLTEKDIQYAGVEKMHLYSEKPPTGLISGQILPIDPYTGKALMPYSTNLFMQKKINVPRTITIYHKPGIIASKLAYLPYWTQNEEYFWFETKDYNSFCHGSEFSSHYSGRPAKPGLLSIEQTDKELQVSGHSFVDSGSNVSSPYTFWPNAFSISAEIDGNLIDAQPHLIQPYVTPIPSSNSDVTINLKASTSPRWSDSVVESDTKIEFNSSLLSFQPIHLPHASYRVANLGSDNRVKTDGTIQFRIVFNTKDNTIVMLSDAMVKLSADGGATWFNPVSLDHKISQIDIKATIPMTQGAETMVTVQLDALTMNHIRIREIIKNAFVLIK